MKERNNSQLGFTEQGGKFSIPENVLDRPWGRNIILFLEKREVWKSRPRGLAFCFEIGGDNLSKFKFDPANWQITENLTDGRYSAALILVDNSTLLDKNVFVSIPLRKKSPVFVFEKRGNDYLDKEGRKERLDILKELGLVERNIFANAISDYWVWEARVEKKRVSREIDLLDKEKHPRVYSWARELWKEMASEYSICGFKVISGADSEIVKRLRKSKNPPDDLGKLKMGWGVEIKNFSCGCYAKIDLNGNVNWIYQCGEEDHHNLPLSKPGLR